MADARHITRRAAFASIGALVSTTALAIPVAAAVSPDPADLIDDLVQALSAALTAEYGGDFECTIGPNGSVSYRWAAMSEDEKIDRGTALIEAGLREKYPGWGVKAKTDVARVGSQSQN